LDEVLAVIQDEQQRARPQILLEGRARRAAGLFALPERRSDRLRNKGRIGQRSQLDQPDPVGVALQDVRGYLERQPGLAGPTGSDDRQQRRGPEQALDLGHLLLPPDEAGELPGQVIRKHVE
jgi:hypothetical protein